MRMKPTKWKNQFGEGNIGDKPYSKYSKKLLGGTAGLTHTAKKIVDLFPDMKHYDYFVEPFAGKARTAKILMDRGEPLKFVLNDISENVNEYCRDVLMGKCMRDPIIENKSFEQTIEDYDSRRTFFLIDPPWRQMLYKNNSFFECDRTIPQYYRKLVNEILPSIEGDWFLTFNADEHECRGVLTKSIYATKIVTSGKKHIFGKEARTLVASNLWDEKK